MLAFQVIPRVKEGNNFEVVDKTIEVVKASGVPFQVSAMETTLKGELNQLLEIVKTHNKLVTMLARLKLLPILRFTARLKRLQTHSVHTTEV